MIIVITGSTGTGKSALAISLAKQIDGEIINGDAFQVYKELSIATAKPSKEDMKKAKHHLFDFYPLDKDYDVHQYQNDARRCIEDIISRGKTPIIAGGTGLYIKTALFDYQLNEDKAVDMDEYLQMDNDSLYEYLQSIDPIEAKKIHKNNRKRVLRAIEIYKQTGQRKSELIDKQEHKPIYDVLFFHLHKEREEIYDLVNSRVDKMIKDGLVEEDKSLLDKYGREHHAFQAIGVKELFPYFDGKISLEEAIEEIKKATRRYVKRQDTFFLNQFNVIEINGLDDLLKEYYARNR